MSQNRTGATEEHEQRESPSEQRTEISRHEGGTVIDRRRHVAIIPYHCMATVFSKTWITRHQPSSLPASEHDLRWGLGAPLRN